MTVFLVLPLLVSSNPMVELREEMEDTPLLGDMVEEAEAPSAFFALREAKLRGALRHLCG